MEVLLEQLKNREKLNDRRNFHGHIAGSAVILSPDFEKVLLIYHPTFDRWQQPGGHWDPDEDGPWLSAKREAVEETGVRIAKRISVDSDYRVPLYINSHLVPTRQSKNEPEHFHHDFRYGFIASSENLVLKDEVIKEAKWIGLFDSKADLLRTDINRLLTLLKP